MISIAIVHQGALGDTVLLIPLMRSLRAKFSPCAITVVTRPNLGQMLAMLGFVEHFASAEDREHSRWFAADAEGPAPLWANADVLISAVSNGRDVWADNARRARSGLGATERLCFFEPKPAADFDGHITAWHRAQLAELGLAAPELPLLRPNPDGAIVIHPGSGGDAKCWPRERFLSLGRTLKRNGLLPTFVLGEAEQEKWGHALMKEVQDEFPWYLHMGLFELAEKMSRARLYLGNDSGVTHLAAAMGVPVIALFGPTDEKQWGPVGAAVTILRADAPDEGDLAKLEEGVVLGAVLAELRKLHG